jgi:hypothetical protein
VLSDIQINVQTEGVNGRKSSVCIILGMLEYIVTHLTYFLWQVLVTGDAFLDVYGDYFYLEL